MQYTSSAKVLPSFAEESPSFTEESPSFAEYFFLRSQKLGTAKSDNPKTPKSQNSKIPKIWFYCVSLHIHIFSVFKFLQKLLNIFCCIFSTFPKFEQRF